MEGIKGSASLTYSYVWPQPSQDPPAVRQDDDQGKKKEEGEGSTFLQGNKPSMEAGKAGSSLAATSHHHVLEEHMLGGNSSILQQRNSDLLQAQPVPGDCL